MPSIQSLKAEAGKGCAQPLAAGLQQRAVVTRERCEVILLLLPLLVLALLDQRAHPLHQPLRRVQLRAKLCQSTIHDTRASLELASDFVGAGLSERVLAVAELGTLYVLSSQQESGLRIHRG